MSILSGRLTHENEFQGGIGSMSNDSSSHKYTNSLIHEKSPYLLQHAHNPVDWYPWAPEAFQKAARESKAVFLSIGYS
ncbi:hypothetical protein AYW79_12625 [Ferroacidibacillus organovorans]|uniref:Spermatogenesis-associated protein 20-like TRX domain-containing protein n=1 Tax=Ferroacidibacillus organovorans TaxID=1765683 RepID=A0A853K7N7_9BACL|nr:hypothetical protein AYJ22_12800 [Ferroacidibacillus organovorans]OAG93050.1 hypothetical protein AYW79_12625 [Ferroacidibacillus organovorans]